MIEEARLHQLEEDLHVAKKAFENYLVELTKALATSPGPYEFGKKDLESLVGINGILRDLDHNAVLVYYFATDEKLRMIVAGPDLGTPPVHRESPIERANLNRLIQEFREKLRSPAKDPRPEAQELYRHMISPVQADLEAYGAKVLMVYLDGALRYVPMAALHDGQRYLVERFATVMYTGAMQAALLARVTSPGPEDCQVGGFGLSEPADGFPALPSVTEELDAIVKESDADRVGVLRGRSYINANFTASHLTDALYKGCRVIHVASHFKLEPGTDEDSFLLMGNGARLSMADLKTKDFPLSDVDLITLSACDTAVGAADSDGREVESFGALAQDHGARAVVATLWEVADRSTALFMAQFYARRHRGQPKAEALGDTQLAFIHGDMTGHEGGTGRGVSIAGLDVDRFLPHGERSYVHPFYWAPFILMGNWL
jgi:CHAT domain-containing protein